MPLRASDTTLRLLRTNPHGAQLRIADNRRSKDSGVVLTDSPIPRYTPTHSGQTLRARCTVRKRVPRCMPHRRKKEVSSHEEHRSRPWWLCGWRWLGGRLQDPETRRLQRQHRPESDDIVGGRRSSYQANSCSAGRTYNSRWPFLRGSGNHGSRKPSKGFSPRIHRCLRSRQGRVGGVAYKGPASRRARTADTAAARRLFVPRQDEVSRFFRSRRGPRKSRVYG